VETVAAGLELWSPAVFPLLGVVPAEVCWLNTGAGWTPFCYWSGDAVVSLFGLGCSAGCGVLSSLPGGVSHGVCWDRACGSSLTRIVGGVISRGEVLDWVVVTCKEGLLRVLP
jgi:hypothetical protein